MENIKAEKLHQFRKFFKDAVRGKTIKHKGSDTLYYVTANYGYRVTAARTVDITNPDEWELLD